MIHGDHAHQQAVEELPGAGHVKRALGNLTMLAIQVQEAQLNQQSLVSPGLRSLLKVGRLLTLLVIGF